MAFAAITEQEADFFFSLPEQPQILPIPLLFQLILGNEPQ